MDRRQYINIGVKSLNNPEFYDQKSDDPNRSYANRILTEANNMKKKEMITQKEHAFIKKIYLMHPHIFSTEFQKFMNSSKYSHRYDP